MRFLLLSLMWLAMPATAAIDLNQLEQISQQPQQQLDKLLAAESVSAEQQFYLAYTYYRLNNADNALTHSQEALKRQPDAELSSRIYLLQALVYGIHKRDTNKALSLLEQAEQSLPSSQNGNTLRLKMDIFESFAQAYNQKGLTEKALVYAQRSLDLAVSEHAPKRELDALLMLGRLELQNNKLIKALALFERATVLAQAQQNNKALASIYTRLGMAYQKLGQFQIAAEQFEQAASLFQQLGLYSNQAAALIDLGDALLSDKQLAAAEQHLEQALFLAQQQQDTQHIGAAYVSQSELAIEKGDLEQAKQLLNNAYQLFSQLGSRNILKEVSLHLVNLYMLQQNWTAAKELLDEVAPAIDETPKYLQKRFYEQSAKLAEQQQQWQQAFLFSQKANEHEETDLAEQQQLQADGLRQNLSLQKQSQQFQQQLERSEQHNKLWLSISLLLLLLSAAGWTSALRHKKHKQPTKESNWKQFQELVAHHAAHHKDASLLIVAPTDLTQQLLQHGPDYHAQWQQSLNPLTQQAQFYCWHQHELWMYCPQSSQVQQLQAKLQPLNAASHSASIKLSQFTSPEQGLPALNDVQQLVWSCWALANRQQCAEPYQLEMQCPEPLLLSWHPDTLRQDLFNAISLGQLDLLVNQQSLGIELQQQLRQI